MSRLLQRRAGVVLLALAAAGALLLLTSLPWVRTTTPPGPGGSAEHLAVHGSSAAALVPALAIVGAAGAVALSTLRGVGRALAGVLVAAAGAGAAAATATVVARPAPAVSAALREATGLAGARGSGASVTPWPVLALVPALVLALAGALAVVGGRRWARSDRFESPADGRPPRGAPSATAPGPATAPVVTRAALWDELSRGGDPTGTPTPTGAPAPADPDDSPQRGENGGPSASPALVRQQEEP